MTPVLDFLVRMLTPDFYGAITLRARAGEVVKVSVAQDYLPATLPSEAEMKPTEGEPVKLG